MLSRFSVKALSDLVMKTNVSLGQLTDSPANCTLHLHSDYVKLLVMSLYLCRVVGYCSQGSTIRSIRILLSEGYLRTQTYSILAYINKSGIRCNYQHSSLIKTVSKKINSFQNCLSQ